MFISEAFAQTAGAPGGGSIITALLPWIFIILIFYFLLIRPQQKRLKQHQAMVLAVKRGDTVVTSGGIVGKVTKVSDNEVTVEIADNVRVQVVKATLSDVRIKGAPREPSENDSREVGHRKYSADETEALEVLGLEKGASAKQIKRAHKELMKKAHPDSGGSSEFAGKLNDARETLLG